MPFTPGGFVGVLDSLLDIRDKALQRLVLQLGTGFGSCGAQGRRLLPEKWGAD